jgi:hypothetical protein
MRGHVIGAFVAMPEQRVAIGHQPSQEAFQIAPHVRIGIFLHDQARRRVAHEKRQQAVCHVGCGRPFGNRASDLDQAAPAGIECQRRGGLPHHGEG